MHVVASWEQGGDTCVWLDGVLLRRLPNTNNGAKDGGLERLILGGHSPELTLDSHNPDVLISDARVYNRCLGDAEVAALFAMGRRSA
jgi:hypothetical protein